MRIQTGCCNVPSPPISPTDTLASPTAEPLSEPGLISTEMTRLSDSYENAYTDFHGSGTPCIYKTGPAWPKRTGHQAQKLYRAARPIHNHSIRPVWLSIAWSIVAKLDTLQVDWNAINPLAYADAGEATLICDFVIIIAVKPGSLLYADAVTAANAIDNILQMLVFPRSKSPSSNPCSIVPELVPSPSPSILFSILSRSCVRRSATL